MASTRSVDVRNPYGRSYKWPTNIYDELTQMGDLSFLVYQLGYVNSAMQKAKELGIKLKGMTLDEAGAKPNIKTSALKSNITPGELKKVIEDNLEFLQEHFPELGLGLSATYKSLDELEEMPSDATYDLSSVGGSVVSSGKAKFVKPWRAVTIEEFEDRFQNKELVYSVIKDTHHQRITLVFRGTENQLGAGITDWLTNVDIGIEESDVPEAVKGNIEDETIGLHKGYHKYLFSNTVDDTDDENFRKYDQIKEDVLGLFQKFPKYKLYVTGHSLGAGVSTMAAFFLACEPDIPKPVSCINFASPRIGTTSFLRACQYLEKTCQLKILRAVNAHDTIAVIPVVKYVHVGFQVTLHKDGKYAPELHYPNLKLGWQEWLKISWRNSIIASINTGYVSIYGQPRSLSRRHDSTFLIHSSRYYMYFRTMVTIVNVCTNQLHKSF
jgi:hypothetical protein